MALTIDVVSDVVCPWCFIGKRRLEEALAIYAREHPDAEPPRVTWRPFQLNPGLPPNGADRAEYYRQKFGDRVGEIVDRVRGAGCEVGIDFRFESIKRQPNTLAAHAVIEHAAGEGKQDAAVEALFRAFFLDGVDLTEPGNLKAVAASAGLSNEGVEAVLKSDEAQAHIASEDAAARGIGVQGVPFFIFNRRLAVSGAQPADVLVEAMRQAEAE
jgi:predicted DsbA family dithiol-disulfide isomerase